MTKEKILEKQQETSTKASKQKTVAAKAGHIVYDVLADIRLPALALEAKKGEEIELTHSQAAFFIHSGQIKRK